MEVRSFDGFLSTIYSLIARQEAKYGDRIWFRGETEVRATLQPSIYRPIAKLGDKSLYNAETHLTNHFQIKASRYLTVCPEITRYDEWMSLMQHYGLPTRILDWTSSPLIALYFATRKWESKKCDAAIYVLFPRKLNEDEGFGPYIPPMFTETVKSVLAPAFSSKNELPKALPGESQKQDKISYGKILACHAASNDERVHMQQSCFTIQTSPNRTIIDACSGEALYKIILPSDSQEALFKGVQTFGITEDYLNPDLEHIAIEAKRFGKERSQILYDLEII